MSTIIEYAGIIALWVTSTFLIIKAGSALDRRFGADNPRTVEDVLGYVFSGWLAVLAGIALFLVILWLIGVKVNVG